MDYDDDSDCPSEEEGLGIEGLHELDEDEDLPNDAEIVDWDEGVADEEWSKLSAQYIAKQCALDIGANDIILCQQLQNQTKHLLDRVREKSKSLLYHGSENFDATRLTNCFLPLNIWNELKSMMDETLKEPVRMRELELLMRFLFAVGAYKTSVGSVLKNPSWYAKAQVILNAFEGSEGRVKELLAAMDPSADQNNWKEPFRRNPKIQEFERMISRSCSEMAWKSGFDLCIDDDKVSLNLCF